MNSIQGSINSSKSYTRRGLEPRPQPGHTYNSCSKTLISHKICTTASRERGKKPGAHHCLINGSRIEGWWWPQHLQRMNCCWNRSQQLDVFSFCRLTNEEDQESDTVYVNDQSLLPMRRNVSLAYGQDDGHGYLTLYGCLCCLAFRVLFKRTYLLMKYDQLVNLKVL